MGNYCAAAFVQLEKKKGWVNTKYSRHLGHKLFDPPQKEIRQTDSVPQDKRLKCHVKICITEAEVEFHLLPRYFLVGSSGRQCPCKHNATYSATTVNSCVIAVLRMATECTHGQLRTAQHLTPPQTTHNTVWMNTMFLCHCTNWGADATHRGVSLERPRAPEAMGWVFIAQGQCCHDLHTA